MLTIALAACGDQTVQPTVQASGDVANVVSCSATDASLDQAAQTQLLATYAVGTKAYAGQATKYCDLKKALNARKWGGAQLKLENFRSAAVADEQQGKTLKPVADLLTAVYAVYYSYPGVLAPITPLP